MANSCQVSASATTDVNTGKSRITVTGYAVYGSGTYNNYGVPCNLTVSGVGTWTGTITLPLNASPRSFSHTFEINGSTSGRNLTCTAWWDASFSSLGGNTTATTTVYVPPLDYDQPNAPSDCEATRASDSQATVTWANGSTSNARPRSSTKVERQADGGDWAQVASVGASATNYTDNSVSANHRYAYRVRAQGAGGNSGYATSGYIYTTPAAPTAVIAEKTGAQSVRLSIEGAAPWATSYDVERSTDGGSQWAAAGTAESFPWVDASAPAGTVVYRVRAVRGDLASAWSQSNGVTTITPPLAPTVTGLPAVAATGSALTVSWVPNHPDGSAQTQAQVEYTIGDGSPQTATVEGAGTSYQLPSSATSSAGTVSVRVRTHGLDPDWGAWSAYSTVAVAVPPSAHFTNPAQDGAVVAALPLALAWEASDATGVSSQTLSLLGADGSTLLTRQLAGDVRSFQIDDSVYALSNLSDYELVLTVLGGSSLSTVAGRSFSTDWAEPSLPAVELETDPDDLSVAVTVHAGDTMGAEAAMAEVPEGKTLGGAVVYGNTRQNLWVNPATRTANGVTLTANADGSFTISGTATALAEFTVDVYSLRPGGTYTISSDKPLSGLSVFAQGYADGSSMVSNTICITNGGTGGTGVLSADATFTRLRVQVYVGNSVSGTYRIMLNEGSTAKPWCPPGLNGVEELSVVTAGKNLNGVAEQIEHVKWSMSTEPGWDEKRAELLGLFNSLPEGEYTLSCKCRVESVAPESAADPGSNNQAGFIVRSSEDIFHPCTIYLIVGVTQVDDVLEIVQPVEISPGTCMGRYDQLFVYSPGSGSGYRSISTFYDIQLEPGTAATAYESHRGSTFAVDLDGHALNSLPDGTRDELRIDGTGAVTLVQRVGVATAPTDASGWKLVDGRGEFNISDTSTSSQDDMTLRNMCDALPVRKAASDPAYALASTSYGYAKHPSITGASTAASIAGGATYLYPLAEPVEVELAPVSLSLAGPGSMWADATVPAPVSPVYMLGSSFSVVRVLADGSQWMVADGLTDGQQCIDPLPPLNVDYSYLVTAYAETGVSSALTAPARIDAATSAFNFGDAAAACELARLDPSWSHSPKRSGTLYHFADGGESGGLPVPYGGADVDSTRSMRFTLLDLDQLRRLQDLAARYYTCWYRDVYGGRSLCAVSWSFSSGVPYRKVEVAASMTEAVFEEAW